MKSYMAIIRWILSKIILFLDRVFTPTPLQRDPAKQAEVDRATASLAVYQFEACPFCVKVRRAMRKMNLNIELRDAKDSKIADELVRGGGELQVPCLQIKNSAGELQWLYESDDIIRFLSERFG